MSMQLISKLGTLIRGGSREALQTLVDANALRILEQEVIDYEQALLAAKRSLTQRVAERLRLEREQQPLLHRRSERESQLAQALEAQRDQEVEPLAERIAGYDDEVQRGGELVAELFAEEIRRTDMLRAAAKELASARRELRLLKVQSRSLNTGLATASEGDLQAAREALGHSLQHLRQRNAAQAGVEQASDIVEQQLQRDTLTTVDRQMQQRQRAAQRAAIIERVRGGAPVRPA